MADLVSTAPLLEVSGLKTSFKTPRGTVKSVDDVSFSIAPGRTLGVVGESGSGKSVTSLSIMRLVARGGGSIDEGTIRLNRPGSVPIDIRALDEKTMRKVRGNDIAMIFQEPMTSLDPVWSIGDQIIEAIRLHQDVSKTEARIKAIEMLRLVGIPAPESRVDDYPHQLSGGMRQRVMIAIALSCRPALLIADEPTTALDVTIQAQILDLIRRLQSEIGMSVLFITHNLGVVAEIADRVAVMYAGQVVEEGPVRTIFSAPRHPYTVGLLKSIPMPGRSREGGERSRKLDTIGGTPPNPLALPAGCRFAPRCPLAIEACRAAPPPLFDVGSDHGARCIRWQEVSK
ncbi:ABC transporter ATP-binding protein [Pelagibacterium sp. 26DY04]|uniref:ABC transporter ATP-binding protein n=1 Tax=Pelagibacterium sp. 26DY04 TaxID=2967130 RepID=UPI002815537D|nr:ABC transporter ATP-binding protein [Pelagibacterium sp. 26DY04]WMT87313.1 ABC transporter ATP-binding protein [Pelagibacterium sp. 26DY04]